MNEELKHLKEAHTRKTNYLEARLWILEILVGRLLRPTTKVDFTEKEIIDLAGRQWPATKRFEEMREAVRQVLGHVLAHAEEDNQESHFMIGTDLRIHETRRELIAFQIRSKRQPYSDPEKWYMSVAEMMEPVAQISPVFYLRADDAEDLARNLLKIAEDSRRACDSSDDET